jgi:hypothetical protein
MHWTAKSCNAGICHNIMKVYVRFIYVDEIDIKNATLCGIWIPLHVRENLFKFLNLTEKRKESKKT